MLMAGDPVRTAWIFGPRANSVSPDVHSVAIAGDFVVVKSAGLSLRYFGPLQLAPAPSETARQFEYRIPLHPSPETGRHRRVPAGVIGTFINGLPIYNQFEALSWNGSNLWHYDAIALNDDGSLTVAGHPRVELDGYPIYFQPGVRSSYRLRRIQHREVLPGGLELMPGQYGPEVGPAAPLGTFAEDHEYVARSGDLDEYNGRFARTTEYPQGTYAYFLTTDEQGRLAYPYLLGPKYYGRYTIPAGTWHKIAAQRIELSADIPRFEAGRSVRLRFCAPDRSGEPVRDFEYVHEQPIHLLAASADLAEFDHIHPELAEDDCYQVVHTFPHGGIYHLWADYSLPGEAPCVDEFAIRVDGPQRASIPLEESGLTAKSGPLSVKLEPQKALRAGTDIPMLLRLEGDLSKLQPYLGAWAHVVAISKDLNTFSHIHPVESAAVHTHTDPGPPPREIHIQTNFPVKGTYKLWAQFQYSGAVITVPFVLEVQGGEPAPTETPIPRRAIRIRVTAQGYDPPRVSIPPEGPVTLAFTRDRTPNCGSEIVFPDLGIRRSIPPGETVLIKLPEQRPRTFTFSCGMGMLHGAVVVRAEEIDQ
jgi:hypothetical protein